MPILFVSLLFAATLAGPFRKAEMEVPETLDHVTPFAVEGHSPRSWKQPLRFGPFETRSVHDGTTFSWSTELFGVRGGKARRAYRLTLETPSEAASEIECRTRAIEAWREGWSVELTDAFQARLACGLSSGEQHPPARLVLGSNGRRLTGRVESAEGLVLEIASSHRLAGSPLPTEGPAGYTLSRAGGTVAAVEVLNRGRVWISPDLDAETRDLAAGTIAALLLYDPESSPEAFGDH